MGRRLTNALYDYAKSLMSRVGSCAFEKAVGEVHNRGNFNNNLDK